MKHILAIIILFLLVGCSATPDEIDSAMEPYMSEHFPDAEYNTAEEKKLYKFVINDKGNEITKDNVDPIMTQTLGQLFTSFYNTSNSQKVESSKLMIVYKSESLDWETQKYTFSELGKMFEFQFK